MSLLSRRGSLFAPQSAAAPTFVAMGQMFSPGTGTSAALDAPTGVQANDIVLAFLYKENTNAVTLPSGEGFSELGHQATTGQDHDTYLYGKVSDGSEPSSYTFSWSGSPWRTGFTMAFRGCATTGTFEDYDGATTGSTAQANTPAVSVTTVGDNRMLVWFAASYDVVRFDLASPQAWPAGYTKPAFEGTQPNTLRLVGTAYSVQATAGSSGTVQASITNGSGSSFPKTAHLVALKPL